MDINYYIQNNKNYVDESDHQSQDVSQQLSMIDLKSKLVL